MNSIQNGIQIDFSAGTKAFMRLPPSPYYYLHRKAKVLI